jgi:hypothetical protein
VVAEELHLTQQGVAEELHLTQTVGVEELHQEVEEEERHLRTNLFVEEVVVQRVDVTWLEVPWKEGAYS